MIKVKGTVRPRALVIAAAVANAAEELGLPMLITSGNDGRHMAGSKHYSDEALDIRTKHIRPSERAALIAVLRRRLGPAYQVILEGVRTPNEHAHIEYDPEE